MSKTIENQIMASPVFATCAVKALVLCGDQFLVLSKPRWVRELGIIWNDLPGGRIDFGELSPQEALRRELQEEIGSNNILIGEPVHMATVVLNSEIHVVATIFHCSTPSKQICLSREHVDYCWMDLVNNKLPLPPWIEGVVAKALITP